MLRALVRSRLLANLTLGAESGFTEFAKAPRWMKLGLYFYVAQMLVGLIAGFAAPFVL